MKILFEINFVDYVNLPATFQKFFYGILFFRKKRQKIYKIYIVIAKFKVKNYQLTNTIKKNYSAGIKKKDIAN